MIALRRSQLPEATRLLARAFDEDPYFCFLAPGARERQRFLRGLMSATSDVALRRSAARAVNAPERGELRGVCLWFRPGTYPPSVFALVRSHARWAVAAGRAGTLKRDAVKNGLRMLSLADAAHPRCPHFYLEVLAVDPTWHGRGVGSSMLRACLAEADQAGLPASLETCKRMNVRLYQRFGFEITETHVVGSSPPMWTMVRPAAPIAPSPVS